GERLELGSDVTRQEGSASLPRSGKQRLSHHEGAGEKDRLRGRDHLGGPEPRLRAPLARERDVEDQLEALFPVVLEDEGQSVILGGWAERERLLDGRKEGGAGRGERNPVADAQDRGKVDRRDRPPRGQVFVELEWAHGLRERSPHMGHEADVRCGDESREVWSVDRWEDVDVRLTGERVERIRLANWADQADTAVLVRPSHLPYLVDVEAGVQRPDVEQTRSGEREKPVGSRPGSQPFGPLDPV